MAAGCTPSDPLMKRQSMLGSACSRSTCPMQRVCTGWRPKNLTLVPEMKEKFRHQWGFVWRSQYDALSDILRALKLVICRNAIWFGGCLRRFGRISLSDAPGLVADPFRPSAAKQWKGEIPLLFFSCCFCFNLETVNTTTCRDRALSPFHCD